MRLLSSEAKDWKSRKMPEAEQTLCRESAQSAHQGTEVQETMENSIKLDGDKLKQNSETCVKRLISRKRTPFWGTDTLQCFHDQHHRSWTRAKHLSCNATLTRSEPKRGNSDKEMFSFPIPQCQVRMKKITFSRSMTPPLLQPKRGSSLWDGIPSIPYHDAKWRWQSRKLYIMKAPSLSCSATLTRSERTGGNSERAFAFNSIP